MVKIAVVAPIPSASVTNAVIANPGDFLSCRHAYFRSFSIFVTVSVANNSLFYSVRNASIGSTLAALRAGSSAASRPATTIAAVRAAIRIASCSA